MRLLHTTEPHFEEFFQRLGDDGFPKYAILSHRWVRDELTYEEMEYLLLSEEDRARVLTPRLLKLRSKIDGPGHKKVVEFRDLAATAGYEWVCTCIIICRSSTLTAYRDRYCVYR